MQCRPSVYIVLASQFFAVAGADELSDALAVCRGLEVDRERLTCYDVVLDRAAGDVEIAANSAAASGPGEDLSGDTADVSSDSPATGAAAAALTVEPSAGDTAIDASQTAPDQASMPTAAPAQATTPTTANMAGEPSQEDLFGLNSEAVRESYDEAAGRQELKELSATVADVRPAGPGRIVVILDNGQVWQQKSSSTLKIKVGDRIIIKKAAFGSFKMKKENANASMRVGRLN